MKTISTTVAMVLLLVSTSVSQERDGEERRARQRDGDAPASRRDPAPDRDAPRTGQEALKAKLAEFVRAGKLTRTEAGQIISAAFPQPKRDDAGIRGRLSREQLLKRFDKDGDGKLSKEEVETLKKAMKPRGEAEKIDWDAAYEKYLKENPRVRAGVDSGKITKERVIAGLKARAGGRGGDKKGAADDLEKRYQEFLRERPEVAEAVKKGKISKDIILQRLRTVPRRGDGDGDGDRDRQRRGDDSPQKRPVRDRPAPKRP